VSRLDDPTDHEAVDDEGPLRKERIDIQRKVSLKFKEFRGFITEFSENISTGGMFIRTTRPQPPGSIFDFELTLGEDYTLIHGLGEVVWVREKDEGFDRPAGMGVRFLSLDPDSRRLIDEIVARRLEKEGGGDGDNLLSGWGMGDGAAPPPLEESSWEVGPADAAEGADEGTEGGADGGFGPLQSRSGPAAGASAGAPNPLAPLPPVEMPDRPEDGPKEPEGTGGALSDLSDLVGGPRGQAPAPEPGEPYGGSSVSPYAQSYQSYRAVGRSRRLSGLLRWRPLGLVLLVVAVVVVLAAGFFLIAPDAAMNLLVGSSADREAAAPEEPEPAISIGPGAAPTAGQEPADAASATADQPGSSGPAPGAAEESAATQPESVTSPGGGTESAGAAGAQTPQPTPAASAPAQPSAQTPSAPAPSEPLPEELQEPAGEPFTRILNITYDKLGDQLVVTIHLDGVVREWNYSLTRINAPPPRELVRIRGAREPFLRKSIPVTAGLVDRIRTGFHPRDGEDEIHVVLDLAAPDVVLERSEAVGDEIHLYLGHEQDTEADDGSPGGRGT